MVESQVVLKNTAPTAKDFIELRRLVGWDNPSEDTIIRSLESSLFWATIYLESRLLGVGRVIGDGEMYFYIQDVLVHPEQQGNGLGTKIMESINGYLDATCKSGATVGLFAAKGKEDFYGKLGYSKRDGELLGLGMCRFV